MLAFAVALPLAACQTSPGPVNLADPTAAQANAADIGSLSTVIQQSPEDPLAYNVRGTAYGQAGKPKEAKPAVIVLAVLFAVKFVLTG